MIQEDKLKIVKKNVNKNLPVNILIIPFAYKNNECYEDTIDELTKFGSELQWRYTKLASEDNELFEHIYYLIGSHIQNYESADVYNGNQSDSCIGNCLELVTDEKGIPNLGNKKEWVEIYEYKDKIGAYRLKSIKMVLFKTGIGFLILDIEYPKNITVTQVAKLNNILKTIKNSKHIFYVYKEFEIELNEKDIIDIKPENIRQYIKAELDKQIKYIPINKINLNLNENLNDLQVHQLFKIVNEKYKLRYKMKYSLEELIDTVLKDINIKTFFNNVYNKKDNKFYPKKAHIFSSVLVENDGWEMGDFQTAFYYLRKGYKETYLPSKSELDIENNKEILNPFLNSYWGISREGCANLCHLTEHDSTNAFFCCNYTNRLDNYIYIYILALHQYYGLLYLSKKTAEINYESKIYINNDEEFKKINHLRDEISFFYLKCIYEEVSHISHQAAFYNKMIDEFGVRRMINELSLEMDRIIGIIAQTREALDTKRNAELSRIKKQSDERKSKYFKILSIAGVLFTIVQTFSAALQTWDITANLNTEFKGFEFVNAVLTVIGAVLLGIIVWGIWCLIDGLKNSKSK